MSRSEPRNDDQVAVDDQKKVNNQNEIKATNGVDPLVDDPSVGKSDQGEPIEDNNNDFLKDINDAFPSTVVGENGWDDEDINQTGIGSDLHFLATQLQEGSLENDEADKDEQKSTSNSPLTPPGIQNVPVNQNGGGSSSFAVTTTTVSSSSLPPPAHKTTDDNDEDIFGEESENDDKNNGDDSSELKVVAQAKEKSKLGANDSFGGGDDDDIFGGSNLTETATTSSSQSSASSFLFAEEDLFASSSGDGVSSSSSSSTSVTGGRGLFDDEESSDSKSSSALFSSPPQPASEGKKREIKKREVVPFTFTPYAWFPWLIVDHAPTALPDVFDDKVLTAKALQIVYDTVEDREQQTENKRKDSKGSNSRESSTVSVTLPGSEGKKEGSDVGRGSTAPIAKRSPMRQSAQQLIEEKSKLQEEKVQFFRSKTVVATGGAFLTPTRLLAIERVLGEIKKRLPGKIEFAKQWSVNGLNGLVELGENASKEPKDGEDKQDSGKRPSIAAVPLDSYFAEALLDIGSSYIATKMGKSEKTAKVQAQFKKEHFPELLKRCQAVYDGFTCEPEAYRDDLWNPLEPALHYLATLLIPPSVYKPQSGDTAKIVCTPSGLAGISLDGAFQADKNITAVADLANRLIPGARALLTLGSHFRNADQKGKTEPTRQLVSKYLLHTLGNMSTGKFGTITKGPTEKYSFACHIPYQDAEQGRLLFIENFGDQMMVLISICEYDDGTKGYKFEPVNKVQTVAGNSQLEYLLPLVTDEQSREAQTGITPPDESVEQHIVIVSKGIWSAFATVPGSMPILKSGMSLRSYALDRAIWPDTFTPEEKFQPKKKTEDLFADIDDEDANGKKQPQRPKLGPQFLIAFVKGDDDTANRLLGEWLIAERNHLHALGQQEEQDLAPWRKDVAAFKIIVNDIFDLYSKAKTSQKTVRISVDQEAQDDFETMPISAIKQLATGLGQLIELEVQLDAKLKEYKVKMPIGQKDEKRKSSVALTTGRVSSGITASQPVNPYASYHVTTDRKFQEFKRQVGILAGETKPTNEEFLNKFITIFEKYYGKTVTTNPYAAQIAILQQFSAALVSQRQQATTSLATDCGVISRAQWLLPVELQKAQELATRAEAFNPLKSEIKVDDSKLAGAGAGGLFVSAPPLDKIVGELKDLFTMPEEVVQPLLTPKAPPRHPVVDEPPDGSPSTVKPQPEYKNYNHWLQQYTNTTDNTVHQLCLANLVTMNVLIYRLREESREAELQNVPNLLRCLKVYEGVFRAIIEDFAQLKATGNAYTLLANLQQLGSNIVEIVKLFPKRALQPYAYCMHQFEGLFKAVSQIIATNKTLKQGVESAQTCIAAFKPLEVATDLEQGASGVRQDEGEGSDNQKCLIM